MYEESPRAGVDRFGPTREGALACRSIEVPAIEARALSPTHGATIVDLRSPAEFAEDHVPGARNVPLFDDVERAIIGTLYVKRSPSAAFAEARGRTRARITALTHEIAACIGWPVPPIDLGRRVDALTAGGIEALEGGIVLEPRPAPPDDALILYCWRGGLRSRSVAAYLRELGLERVVVVAGGYKAYRAEVRRRIAAWEAPASFVLRGLTGVGKTLVLRAIEELRPGWTLDLEELAGHRSSILGMVGLEPATQKTFESRLARRLAQGFPGSFVVEGESRKVGDVVLPPRVWEAIAGGTAIELTATLDRRVQVLIDDYLEHPRNRDEIRRQLPFIEDRLGAVKWRGVLTGLLDAEREAELVEVLLERYYDPLYRHSERRHRYATTVDASDPRRAAAEIVRWAGAPSSA